jgi:hypothetical protein
MKALSEQLSELSERAKRTEDLVAAARQKDRAQLEAQRAKVTGSLAAAKASADQSAANAKDKVGGWWSKTRSSVDERFAGIHAKADKRQTEHDAKRAEHHAEQSEQDASDAVEFALYVLDEAECAVIDAAIARTDADALAAGSSANA